MKQLHHAARRTAALTLAALLLAGCSLLDRTAGDAPTSTPDSSPPPAPSAPAAQSTPGGGITSRSRQDAPAEADDNTFHWLRQPEFDFDNMWTLTAWAEGTPPGTEAFLNVGDDTLSTVVPFDAPESAIFEPYESHGGVYFCPIGCAHGVPAEYELSSDIDEANEKLAAAGFPFETSGGHGGPGQTAFIVDPDSGELVLCYVDYGIAVPILDEWLEQMTLLAAWPVMLASDEENPDFPPMEGEYTPDFTRYGLATADGKELLPVEYEEVRYRFADVYAYKKDGRWGYIDGRDGTLLTDAVITTEPNPFIGGYCAVEQDGKWGFLARDGQMAVEPQFDGATHVFEGRAWVKVDGLWGQIELTK